MPRNSPLSQEIWSCHTANPPTKMHATHTGFVVFVAAYLTLAGSHHQKNAASEADHTPHLQSLPLLPSLHSAASVVVHLHEAAAGPPSRNHAWPIRQAATTNS